MMKCFQRNESGNIAMLTALAGGVLLSAVGIAVDVSSVGTTKANLQAIVDTAALAGATAAEGSSAEREQTVRNSIQANANGDFNVDISKVAVIQFDDARDQVVVTIPYEKPLFFAGVVGRDNMRIAPSATVSYLTAEVAPITVAMAVDSSGSMTETAGSGQAKIAVLQDATRILFEELERSSENPGLLAESLRTSIAAYNTDIVMSREMDFGWRHMMPDVDELVADGGTNSTSSLQFIYDQLLDDRAFRRQQDPDLNLGMLKEFAVFMTDGDNNQVVFDEESSAVCTQMREDNILIYSVAFTAPEKGQLLLLDCASFNTDDDGDGDEGDGDGRCENNGSQGNGRALGHCGREDEPDNAAEIARLEGLKSDYYFDADNADAFREAFGRIGREISKSDIRIKS